MAPMRGIALPLLLVVTLCTSAVLATFPEIVEGDDEITAAIKKVQQTWDPSKGEIFDDSMFAAVEKVRPIRKKRAVSEDLPASFADAVFVPPNQFCDLPGYTGENCEFPICESLNQNIPDPPKAPSSVGYHIDMGMMANCSMSMNTVLDSELTEIHIRILASGSATPSFVLYNSVGKQIGEATVVERTSTSYQANFIPQPPGVYVIQAVAVDPNFMCYLTVKGLSSLAVIGGFVPYSDVSPPERNDFPNTRESHMGEPETFVVHAKGLDNPGSLVSFSVIRDYNIVSRPQKLSIRYGCGYEYYQENFICRATGSHLYRIEGIDFFGNKFRRLGTFSCIMPISASTAAPGPSTSPGPLVDCGVHGYRIVNPDGSSYCMCKGYYTGERCRLALCLNGGTRSGLTSCICPQGFSGLHCEDIKCPERSGFGFSTSKPSLIVVVRLKSSLSDVIKQVGDQIQNIVYNLALADPQYLTTFGLVLFNNNQLISEGNYRSAAEMKEALYNATLMATADGGCEDVVFSGIEGALNGGIYMKIRSPIYVITDAFPNDEQAEESIFQYNSFWRTPIYVIFIEPAASSGCQFDEYAPGYRQLEYMTRKASGHVFFIPAGTPAADVGKLLYTHLRYTIYYSNVVYSNDATKCSQLAAFQAVTVDFRFTELTIVATGKNLNLTITDPKGDTPAPTTTYVLNDIYVWNLVMPSMGQYLFHIQSAYADTPCSYRIYSDQYQLMSAQTGGQHEYDIFWAYTPQLQIDGPNQQPVYNVSESMVVHLNNYNVTDALHVFAELTIYHQTPNGREAVFLSNGLWRDQCDYQLYFAPYKCMTPDELLYFTVFLRDDLGYTVQRSGVAYCSYAQPTPPPAAGCQNGGAQVTSADNTTACYCPPNWSGDVCQTRVCTNGGTYTVGAGSQRCICPPGFSGESCEYVSCIEEGPGEPYNPLGRQMAFVVELTTASSLSIYRLAEYFPSLYKDIAAHRSEWIQTYILAAYNSTWAGILAQVDRSNIGVFQDALNNALASLTGHPDNECRVRVWHALDIVLGMIEPEAYVNVFHVSAPEQNDTSFAENAIRQATEKRVLVNVFYSYRQTSTGGQLLCNQTSADYSLLEELADTNGGRAYPVHQGQFLDTYHMIPNNYLAGLVYVRDFPNCHQDMGTVYFPVDSFTQAIQINSLGYMNDLHVYRPDGTEFIEVATLLDDVRYAGWRISEVRRPCDSSNSWEPVGQQQCAQFRWEQFTWQQAHDACHENSANMYDELEQDKDAWVEMMSGSMNFWIGLSDIDNDGIFEWDSQDGTPPVPFNNTMYSNWGADEPSTDPEKRCVARLHKPGVTGGKWYTQSCNLTYGFICEKHKFDQDMQPNDINDDDLPSGKWRLTIKATKAPANRTWIQKENGCVVEVRMQSGLQVFPGFLNGDTHGDNPSDVATLASSQNRFVTHVYGGQGTRPAILSYANIYDFNTLAMVESTTYQERVGCSYPWLSQTFSCPGYDDPNTKFSVIHIGEDQYGLNFQRMTTARCVGVLECHNGGVLYNGMCVCTSYWKGRFCDTPVCVNGGMLDTTNTTCLCPLGYTGLSCEHDECLPQVAVPDYAFTVDKKTFAVVLEMTQPNQAAVKNFIANVQSLLTNANASNPKWFSNFLAVTIDSTSVLTSFSRTDIASFAQGLQALPAITDPGNNCGAPLYGGLTRAMNAVNFVSQGSVVFVITRSTPTDKTAVYDDFMKALSEKKPQINYMVVNDNEQACGKDADHADVKDLGMYALTSGGNMFLLSTGTFMEFLTVYLPTVYTSTLLTTPTLADMTCADKRWFAQVDFHMTAVYITVFTTAGGLSVVDPHGDVVAFEDMYNTGKTRLVYFSPGFLPGIYTITMSSPTPCMVQVRGDSPLTVYTGFAQVADGDTGAHIDAATADPVSSASNIVLLHLAGIPLGSPVARLTYTELLNPYTNKIFVSQLYRRYNCSYEYYSRPFSCPDTSFLVMVNGIDDLGLNFRREVAIAYCAAATQPSSFHLSNDFVDLDARYQP